MKGRGSPIGFLAAVAAVGSLTCFALAGMNETERNRLIINADSGKYVISRHIYGHFSEHLGRCIYGGFWVGEKSPIPNTRGIRSDVVEALKSRWRLPISGTGRKRRGQGSPCPWNPRTGAPGARRLFRSMRLGNGMLTL